MFPLYRQRNDFIFYFRKQIISWTLGGLFCRVSLQLRSFLPSEGSIRETTCTHIVADKSLANLTYDPVNLSFHPSSRMLDNHLPDIPGSYDTCWILYTYMHNVPIILGMGKVGRILVGSCILAHLVEYGSTA